MPSASTRDLLMRRIDRCYLVAAWTKVAAKRDFYLERARYYRALLRRLSGSAWSPVEVLA